MHSEKTTTNSGPSIIVFFIFIITYKSCYNELCFNPVKVYC